MNVKRDSERCLQMLALRYGFRCDLHSWSFLFVHAKEKDNKIIKIVQQNHSYGSTSNGTFLRNVYNSKLTPQNEAIFQCQ